jgi:maltooligosyltrehalose trehalohydrolase
MGEEYAELAPFPYFVSHEDANLIEAVRHGRKEEFAKFNWSDEIPDPQSEQTFLSAKLNWDRQTGGQHRSLWHFYQKLLSLRRTVPALAHLDKNNLEVRSYADNNTLSVTRGNAPDRICAAFHFGSSSTQAKLPIPAGTWTQLLDSAEDEDGSSGAGDQTKHTLTSKGEMQLSLKQSSFILLAEIKPDN